VELIILLIELQLSTSINNQFAIFVAVATVRYKYTSINSELQDDGKGGMADRPTTS
jgi:hypothetical protein